MGINLSIYYSPEFQVSLVIISKDHLVLLICVRICTLNVHNSPTISPVSLQPLLYPVFSVSLMKSHLTHSFFETVFIEAKNFHPCAPYVLSLGWFGSQDGDNGCLPSACWAPESSRHQLCGFLCYLVNTMNSPMGIRLCCLLVKTNHLYCSYGTWL